MNQQMATKIVRTKVVAVKTGLRAGMERHRKGCATLISEANSKIIGAQRHFDLCQTDNTNACLVGTGLLLQASGKMMSATSTCPEEY